LFHFTLDLFQKKIQHKIRQFSFICQRENTIFRSGQLHRITSFTFVSLKTATNRDCTVSLAVAKRGQKKRRLIRRPSAFVHFCASIYQRQSVARPLCPAAKHHFQFQPAITLTTQARLAWVQTFTRCWTNNSNVTQRVNRQPDTTTHSVFPLHGTYFHFPFL